MFTGLISAVGQVQAVETNAQQTLCTFACPRGWLGTAKVGDSIAVNGVCLTATAIKEDVWTAGISTETRARCIPFVPDAAVNLEHALRVGDAIGGHFVSGHVDGQARISAAHLHGDEAELHLQPPAELAPFIAVKGAITLNGVSLTVNAIHNNADGETFSVRLIPHTRRHTNLASAQPGDTLNIEIDLIARHLKRLLPTTPVT